MSSIRERAMNFLARREHTKKELRVKLSRYDYDECDINAAIVELEDDNLQSDSRFVEDYVRHKKISGYGPAYIKQQLQARGIDSDTAATAVLLEDDDANSWDMVLFKLWNKKYKDMLMTPQLKAKAMRFLLSRGFDIDSIYKLLNNG